MTLNGIDYGRMPSWMENNELAARLFVDVRLYLASKCESEHAGDESWARYREGMAHGLCLALWELSKDEGYWYTPLSFESFARELNRSARADGHEYMVTDSGQVSLAYC